MKKIILFAAVLLTGINSTAVFAQAFKRNNFILNGGVGIGVGYGYRNFTAANLNHTSGDIYDIDLNYSAGVLFPVSAEYAISNKFGIGGSFQHGSYINTNANKSTANSFGLFGAFHFARKEKLELYTRLSVGLSFLNYVEDNSDYIYYSSTYNNITSTDGSFQYALKGGYVKPSFGMRLYFTQHIGFFADAGFGIYSLKTSQVETNTGTYDLPGKPMHLVMVNFELTTGLAVKF
ncbi:MAG: hypothetical protein JWO58_657 [Chitinophagaceae bacterium]|nr:hypothetical protein [Chitinophagaceae bacterium]